MQLKKLFEPITIAGIEIKNRIKIAPMDMGYAEDGYTGDKMVNHYEERARGGYGLIDVALWPTRVEHGYSPYIYHDKFIPGLRRLTEAVHRHGAKVICQVGTGYAWAFGKGPVEIVGPSGISLLRRPGTPFRVGTPTNPARTKERPMTIAEIQEMVAGYGDSARRAREAGFDGIEVMCAAGYTIARFISTLTNKRNDEYGGPLENRLRLLREVIADMKKKAGEDYPIFAKISGAQFVEGGYTLEECANELVPAMESYGVCCVDIVVGWHEAPKAMLTHSVPEGAWIYLAEAVKKRAKVPIVGGARISDVRVAEEALAQGRMDMVALGRPSIADPEIPNKAREGRLEDVITCIACNWCMETVDTPVKCSVNPRTGMEGVYTLERAKEPKKVFVIGAGPAGIEAAVTAAKRGHQVTLFEKENKLGGQLWLASTAPHKELIANYRDHLIAQVSKNGIQVRLGEEVNLETIKDGAPDAVIVATGADPLIPSFPGVMGPNVVLASDVLLGKRDTGEDVVVIGGGLVGTEVAELLAQQGKHVVILEMLDRIANDVPRGTRFDIMMRLRDLGIQTEPSVEVNRITEHGVWGKRLGYEAIGPNDVFFEADTVVLAVGMKANNRLAQQLEGKVKVYNVGDSARPRKILDSIAEGFLAAREI